MGSVELSVSSFRSAKLVCKLSTKGSVESSSGLFEDLSPPDPNQGRTLFGVDVFADVTRALPLPKGSVWRPKQPTCTLSSSSRPTISGSFLHYIVS